jgi:hypothetical protein
VQKESGVRLPHADLVTAEDGALEVGQETGQRQAQLELLSRTVRSDAATLAHRAHQVERTIDRAQAEPKRGGHSRTKPGNEILGQGSSDPPLDLCHTFRQLAAAKGCERLVQRHDQPVLGDGLDENLVGQNLTVDQGPIAIEDDDFHRGTEPPWPRHRAAWAGIN